MSNIHFVISSLLGALAAKGTSNFLSAVTVFLVVVVVYYLAVRAFGGGR